tara:strand:+ start:147 stop:317 length:171 start_codon:yes stop_codon:yes gene_type:complete
MTTETFLTFGSIAFGVGIIIGYLWGQVRLLRRHEYMMLDVAMQQLKKDYRKDITRL